MVITHLWSRASITFIPLKLNIMWESFSLYEFGCLDVNVHLFNTYTAYTTVDLSWRTWWPWWSRRSSQRTTHTLKTSEDFIINWLFNLTESFYCCLLMITVLLLHHYGLELQSTPDPNILKITYFVTLPTSFSL